MRNWYRQQKLGMKFTILFLGIFVIGIGLGGVILDDASQRIAQRAVESRGDALLETMNAVRTYTSTEVNPLLSERLYTDAQFIAQTVPGYSARTVFDNLRRNSDYEHYLYKEATLNPTNPRDLADAFEAALVNDFKADDELEEVTGYRRVGGEDVFYIARPIVVSSESCLQCHSSPAVAPESQLATYGDTGGFGWELGEIVGTQVVYVPASDIFSSSRRNFYTAMGIFVALFATGIVTLNVLLRRTISKPLTHMSALAEQLREGKDDSPHSSPEIAQISERGDELGSMARVFAGMANAVRSREKQLKAELQQLRIEIDEDRREQEVKRIADSDYFRDLQTRAAELRQRFEDKKS